MPGDNSDLDETFPPTSGRFFGFVALGLSVVVVVVAVIDADGVAWAGVALGVLLAAVAWTAMLRPRVSIQSDVLVLRNMVTTVRVPLAAIEDVAVRQVLAVRAGARRYTSPAVGRPRRQMIKEDRRSVAGTLAAQVPVEPSSATSSAADLAAKHYGLYIQERITERAVRARTQLGIEEMSDEQVALAAGVRRELALPEIGWLATSAAAAALLLAL